VTGLGSTFSWCSNFDEPDLVAVTGTYYSLWYDDYQEIPATHYNDNEAEYGWKLASYQNTLWDGDDGDVPTTTLYRKCPDETTDYAVRPQRKTMAKVMYAMTGGDSSSDFSDATAITGQNLLWFN